VLDTYLFSKPYFDRHGFILAEEEGELAGFVHAGFGPNEDQTDVATEMGVSCMIMVSPQREYLSVARQLLEQSESYLRGRGAKLLYGGCIAPLNPFYLGLYGGSELPGTLASDARSLQLYKECGYEEVDRVIVLQRDLNRFRMPVDRRQMQLRRQYRVTLESTVPPMTWWEACTGPPSEPTCFQLSPLIGGPARGSVRFWVIEPLSATWGALASGMTHLEISSDMRRQGLATFLNGEALRQLQENGIGLVEVQTMRGNAAALGLYRKLGFVEVDQGIVLRKS
jgi:ribosomal protein S18 acetylase RimI-like enzyme